MSHPASAVSVLDRRADPSQHSTPAARPTLSVVIPTLNEEQNLPHVLAGLPAGVDEVIVVDGHSTDDTVGVARRLRPDVRIVMQTRRGKGNALASGFAVASGEIIVMLDADGSTDPREIPRFVAALLAGADFAKGSRFVAGGHSDDITPVRRLGNRFLNGLVNLAYRTRYTDLCYGYNAFWRSCLQDMQLDVGGAVERQADRAMRWGDGFEIETIINVRVARAGLRIAEVPSYERPRLHGASNLSAVSDGLRVLRCIASERFRSTRRPRADHARSFPDVSPALSG